MGRGAVEGGRARVPATARPIWEVAPDGRGTRTLGWDVTSSYSRTMAPFFPEGSVGHLGFTGTALWIDPPTRSYIIILSNRVHPYGGGASKIQTLRTRLAAGGRAPPF